jgi:hypothetical protein
MPSVARLRDDEEKERRRRAAVIEGDVRLPRWRSREDGRS